MKSFNPKISIIIPVYNGSNFMREAIDSALAQSYDNIEILVINDGSKDNTEEVALSYGDKIKYFSKPNGGVSTALNLGIEKMEGDYFSWLSHDDLYLKDKIKLQIEYLSKLKNKDAVILFGNWHIINKEGAILRKTNLSVKNGEMLMDLLIDSPINGCTLLIPKRNFDIAGGFSTDLRNTQDVDLWFRFAQKFNFHFLDHNMVANRQHSNQVTYLSGSRHLKEVNQFLINSFKAVGSKKLGLITHRSPKEVEKLLLVNWSKRGYHKASSYLIHSCDFSIMEKLSSKYHLFGKMLKNKVKKIRLAWAFKK